MAVITWILGLVTASLIPIIYFIWQINDRNSRQMDKAVGSAVVTAVQAEQNRSNISIGKLKTKHEINMLKYRVNLLEKYLSATTSYKIRDMPDIDNEDSDTDEEGDRA